MNPVPSIQSASEIQMDYMKLLIAQLQNQNPLEPMNNNEMASQLAQFSSLSQLESMSKSFSQVLATTNRGYANSLLGKTVTFYSEDETNGVLEKTSGIVDSVFNDPETDEILLGIKVGQGEEVDGYAVGLDDIVLVED